MEESWGGGPPRPAAPGQQQDRRAGRDARGAECPGWVGEGLAALGTSPRLQWPRARTRLLSHCTRVQAHSGTIFGLEEEEKKAKKGATVLWGTCTRQEGVQACWTEEAASAMKGACASKGLAAGSGTGCPGGGHTSVPHIWRLASAVTRRGTGMAFPGPPVAGNVLRTSNKENSCDSSLQLRDP